MAKQIESKRSAEAIAEGITDRAGRRPSYRGQRIALLACGVGFVAWCGVRIQEALKTQGAMAEERKETARAAAAAPVAVAGPATVLPTAEKWTPRVSFEGSLSPAHETDLSFKVGGRLTVLRARLGDRVREGAELAALEDSEAKAQVQAVDAQVRAAQAQAALADDGARRTTALVGTGSAPEANGIQATQQRQLATAQLDAARAQLALSRATLRNHSLVAPFAGTVTKVPSGVGAIVGPGVPLFHLQDTTTLKLSGSLSESEARLIKPGAAVRVLVGGRQVEGRVRSVLASLDPATRRVPVEAEVKNDPRDPVFAGTFVRATVDAGGETPVLKLPGGALRPGSQDEVLVVAEAGRLSLRHVEFSLAADGSLLVRGGLSPADRVLLAPTAETRDGDPLVAGSATPAAATDAPNHAGGAK